MFTPNDLALFTRKVNILRYPTTSDKVYKILALTENCDLADIYDDLLIMKSDIKIFCNPKFKIGGKVILTNKEKMSTMKRRGLITFPYIKQVDSTERNVIIDLTEFGREIRTRLRNNFNSTTAAMFFATAMSSFASSKTFYNTLLYIIDTRKPFEVALNRKLAWIPIFHNLRQKENIPYVDSMILCVINKTGKPIYIKLFDKKDKIDFSRCATIIKGIKVSKDNLETFGEEIANSIDIDEKEKTIVSDDTKKKDLIRVSNDKIDSVVRDAISNLSQKHPEEVNNIINELNSTDKSLEKEIRKKSIMLAAVKYKLTNNKDDFNDSMKKLEESTNKKLSEESLKDAKSKIDLEVGKYVERMSTDFKTVNISTNPVNRELKIKEILSNNLPSRILENKQTSFNLQLFNDLVKMLKTFQTKDFPLKLTKYSMAPKYDETDLKANKLISFKFTMKDNDNHEYNNEILLPLVNSNGTMTINGLDKILVGQLMLKPVYFPEMHTCKISTFFSTIQLQYREIREKAYTIAYITGMVVPLYLVYSNLFKRGLDELFSRLGFSRKDIIITKDPVATRAAKKENAKWFIQFDNNEYAFFPVKVMETNPIAKTFFHSMKLINYTARHISVDQFMDNERQGDILILNTGKKNALYNLKSFFNNFLDPISLEIIEEQGYPTKLEPLLWKCTELIHTEKADKRTNLNIQRYRTTETFLHVVYKQLLMAYNVYQNKKLMGYTKSEFEIKPDFVYKEVVNTQLVRGNETINPIEELSAATRMTYVGVGGVANKDGVPERMRTVDESYFGTIDAIDTPEGGSNIGLLQHATVGTLLKDVRGSFEVKPISGQEKTGISSVSSVMTPFGNHDDGARGMMAANQIRQALPLMHKEVPLVQTGYETGLTTFLSNSFIKKSQYDGIVKSVTEDAIIIESIEKSSKGKRQIIDLNPTKLNSGSTTHSISYFEPKVSVGQRIKKYHLAAEGSCIKDGTISLGTNLLVAFMPYHGANHDDSIVISSTAESYVTSKHVDIIKIHVLPDSKIIEAPGVGENGTRFDIAQKLITIGDGIPYEKGDVMFSYLPDNLAKFIELNPEERIYGGGLIKYKADKPGKIIDVKLYANDDINKYPKLKQLYLVSREKHKTISDANYKIKGDKFEGIMIEFTFEYLESGINNGDKFANRHGNKGVIALVDEQMPVTPWGQKIDIIFNPLGVIGRMNPGQLFESYLGLIAWKVREEMLSKPSQKNMIDIIKKVYFDILDKSKDKMISKTVLKVISSMNNQEFNNYLEQLRLQKGFSWIFPTYDTPKLNDINKALQIVGLKDKYILDLPKYGKGIQTKEPVPVGYLYLYKMEHISSHKISSRSVGSYESRSRQPSKTASSKGGQRVGEFDSWSLFSHGATNVIKEMFGPLSDDYISKNELVGNIVENGFTHSATELKVTPTRDILEVYFRLMLLDFNKK